MAFLLTVFLSFLYTTILVIDAKYNLSLGKISINYLKKIKNHLPLLIFLLILFLFV